MAGLGIQNALDQGMLKVAGAAATHKVVNQQELQLAADNASDKAELERNKTALENDQYRAQQAILAHANKENLTPEEVDKLKEDPAYAQDLRETKLRDNRRERLAEAAENYEKASKETGPYNQVHKEQTRNLLDKGYQALQELEMRISATNEFKFNIENAKARLEARGAKK